MGQLNFQTTGQALVIASSTATLYTDAAYSSPVTLPAAYAADTALYTREGSPTIVVTQPDGTVLFNGQVQVGTVYPAVLKPLPTFEQIAADVSMAQQILGLLDSGQETVPRVVATNTGGTPVLTSQQARFFYFTARKSFTATQVRFATGGTAAGATPTLVKFGVYSVNADGSLSLQSATVNDTALLAAPFTGYTKALSSSVTITAGRRYAVAALVVTAAAAPTLVAAISGLPAADIGTTAPVLAKTVTGQSDLAASYSAGSLVDTAWVAYGVVLP